jgi:hypothetical protein
MRETTSETVYPHPWHLVFNAYNLRYPTHERLPLLLEVKEISNKFELREGCDECVGGKKKQQKLAPAPLPRPILRTCFVLLLFKPLFYHFYFNWEHIITTMQMGGG